MKFRTPVAVAIVACLAFVYLGYRVYNHERNVQPAIVTPSMDAQQEVSPSIAGYFKRFFHERVAYDNRAGRPKLIALSFDDGPYPVSTPLLLDELRVLHVHATFFLIGRDAQQWPQLAQRIESSGNEVADHTFSHPNLDQESSAQVREEILQGRDVLYALAHDRAARYLFRPPHGRYTLGTIQVAQSLGYTTVLWTDDGGDWRTVTPQSLGEHLELHATAPEIALLHSGKLPTIAMLPAVVARFRAAGYRFVTVGELLAHVTAAELNHPAKHPV